jgi:hypothetical protein
MSKIQLFLASSEELKADREQFVIFINSRNDLWADRDVYLKLNRCEDFLDAMSRTRLQDEYNKVIRECDIFVLLFATKVGKYTAEEFEVAYQQFKATGKPVIFTYFKDTQINVDNIREEDYQSLRNFQEKLKELGHFWTKYSIIEGLREHFGNQLDKLVEKGFIALNSKESYDAGENSVVVNQTAEKIYNIGKIDKADFN